MRPTIAIPFRSFLTLFILSICLFAAVPESRAATDIFLKIDGIDGESADDKHRDWIEITSVVWGAADPGGDGSSHEDIVLTKIYDKASPKLIFSLTQGDVIPQATFEMIADVTGDAMTPPQKLKINVMLTNVRFTSYQFGGLDDDDDGDGFPEFIDQVSLTYETIEWVYERTDEAGAIVAGSDSGVLSNPSASSSP